MPSSTANHSACRVNEAESGTTSSREMSLYSVQNSPDDLDATESQSSQIALRRQLSGDFANTQFWWRTAGKALALLLHHAQYPIHIQYEHLIFFALQVAPQLGPSPAAPQWVPSQSLWKSFMCDDHTPIELSWDWGVKGDTPKIRYSYEPIGEYAGGFVDPCNERATMKFVQSLRQSVPDRSFNWFMHFAREFLVFGREHRESHETRFFSAVDLGLDGKVMVKAYFFPAFKAASESKSKLQVIGDAFESMPGGDAVSYRGFVKFRDFVAASPVNEPLDVEMLAIDCTEPDESRLKIYARCMSTCFDSVQNIMTLGGRLDSTSIRQGIEELRHLWSLLFGESYSNTDELAEVGHRTSGILYNFDIAADGGHPVPKVYIPVRHYTGNDMHVVDCLQAILSMRRGPDFSVDGYRRVLCKIFSPERLRATAGVQTYLACAIKKDGLRIVSYFNPRCAEVEHSLE